MKKPKDRWLMYLSDPNMFSKFLTEKELARYNEISEAIEVLETKNFTPEQLRGYELYIDNIRSYVTNMAEAKREGLQQGRAEAQTIMMDNTICILQDLRKGDFTTTQIAEKYSVTINYVEELKETIS